MLSQGRILDLQLGGPLAKFLSEVHQGIYGQGKRPLLRGNWLADMELLPRLWIDDE